MQLAVADCRDSGAWSMSQVIIKGWEFRTDGAICPAPGYVGPDVLIYADEGSSFYFKTDISFTAAPEVLAELLRRKGWLVTPPSHIDRSPA
jgi:hypothetical protein